MEQEEALVVNDMTQSVVRLYNERHGPAELTIPMGVQISRGFEQWLPFFRESGLETAVNEDQLTQMFGQTYEYVPVHQGAPQEPRTPEQATTTMPTVTPEKMNLRALIDIPREPEGLQTCMEQEEALLVVAVYDAGTLVRAVDRGLIARRSKAALLVWRTRQLLSAIGDAQQHWCRSGDQLLRELVRLWGVVHAGTAVASWRQHLPTGKQVTHDPAVTRAQAAT